MDKYQLNIKELEELNFNQNFNLEKERKIVSEKFNE